MTATATRPQAPSTAVSWHLPEVFMLRTAALPIEVADELACEATAAWARRLLDYEGELLVTGRAVFFS